MKNYTWTNGGVSLRTGTAKLKLSLFYLADSNNLYEQSLVLLGIQLKDAIVEAS